MNLKTFLFVGYLTFGFVFLVQAKEEKLKTQVLNWSINPSNFYSKQTLKENKTCGQITMDFPHNIYFSMSSLFIKINDAQDQKPMIQWFKNKIEIPLYCTIHNIQMNPRDSNNFVFNPKIQKWVWKDDNSSDGIYQIKAKNGTGWLIADEPESIMGTKGSAGDDYIRNIGFCITNNAHTKQLCGAGNVQYIPHKKDINKNIGNYTETIYKILQTTNFLDDK